MAVLMMAIGYLFAIVFMFPLLGLINGILTFFIAPVAIVFIVWIARFVFNF
jgi:hypothetical protein